METAEICLVWQKEDEEGLVGRDWTPLIEIAINCNYLIAIIIFIRAI